MLSNMEWQRLYRVGGDAIKDKRGLFIFKIKSESEFA